MRFARQFMGVALAAVLAAACASQGTSTGDTSDPRGTLSESGSDPGMSDRSGSAGGMTEGGLRTIYFAFDDYSLSGASKNTLQSNAALMQNAPNARLEIQGNCDERGTEEYNLALGKKRAEAAKQYLVDLGVSSGQLTTISFGEENPAVRGSTEAAWAKNRRGDFVMR